MTEEQVLGCMGPPSNRTTEGQVEVWVYGDGSVKTTDGGVESTSFCTVKMAMQGGSVSTVSYQGPTGEMLTQGEQCVHAVNRCAAR
jgi:hypothetical protein